ncbi:hypothetical protein GOODEAATRI_014550 [Goodea atripinnis]|uniref:Uncharacterized protein n=1 Tax=Goodea atripinnis TaxID=208336 RepID=A0ABV0P4A0_9TELE
MTTVRMNYSYYTPHPTCLLTIRSPSHRILSLVPARSTQFKPFALKHQSPPSIKPVVLDAVGSTNQLASAGSGGPENGLLAPPHNTYVHQGERARAMSASGKPALLDDPMNLEVWIRATERTCFYVSTIGWFCDQTKISSSFKAAEVLLLRKPVYTKARLLCLFLNRLLLLQSCSARDQLMLGGLNSDAPRSSRDSLHCSSGYSTQTTTPSCSEDTIHTHTDYESISLHGDADTISFHQLSHGNSQSDFDKSSTIPRNSDLRFQYREFAQSKRPTSTISLLAEGELGSSSGRRLSSHTATIRRKPSSKPAYRRGTISGGIPIPISTPQVPLKAVGGNGNSDENVFKVPPPGGVGGLGHNRLCTSTQSLGSLPSSSSPYYQFIPGQMPIPWNQFGPPAAGQQQQKQMMLQQQHQAQLQATAAAQVQPNNLEPRLNHQSLNDSSSQDQNPEQPAQEGGGVDMLTLIRKVKLKQTVTNDRSAPLLPPPVNHN